MRRALVACLGALAALSIPSFAVRTSAGICASCEPRKAFDFDADGKVDLIRSGPTGIRVDLLDGTSVVGGGTFPNAGGSFALKAVGLLNGDDNSDFVSQGNGQARVTFVNAAGTGTASTLFIADGGGSWQVVDVADVSGDGIDEVIFEGTGAALGSVRIANIASGSPVFSYLGTGGGVWTYALDADLNGDSQRDLLFRGTGAANGMSRVNRNGGTANVKFLPQGGGAWHLKLAGDFDGDGIDDLVDTANPTSFGFDRVRVFDTIGTGNPDATGFVPNGGGFFVLKAAGDFNGDNRSDLAYDSASTFRVIAMNGATSGTSFYAPNGGGSYLLRRMGDTNADSRDDLIATNAAGDVRIQLSNASAERARTTIAGSGDAQGAAQPGL